LEIGATVLPNFAKDATDRNRTSPFAFTGNKFEFRMVGASASIADANIMLGTAVAEILSGFADSLEKKNGDFKENLANLIKKTIKNHKKIIYNGNNYSKNWEEESKRRGLPNYLSAVDALPGLISEKNIQLFAKHDVFTENELRSRYEILLENYCKTIHIEALTFIEMAKRGIIPSSFSYQNEIAELAQKKRTLNIDAKTEEKLLDNLSSITKTAYEKSEELEAALAVTEAADTGEAILRARFYRDKICPLMSGLRGLSDLLETLVAKKYWVYPTYGELLYSVN
jgi:glutamine synthetase